MLRKKIFNRSVVDLEKIQNEEEEVRVELLLTPNDLKNLERLSMLLFYKGDCKGALEIYEKIYKLGKKTLENIGFLGYLYYENGNYSKAVRFFNRFLDKKPQEAFVHFLLGNAYSREGKILEAVNSYELAIFLDLDIYKAHLEFAEDYEKIGRNEKALIEYVAAYEIDPRDKKIKKKINSLKKKTQG